MVKLYKKTIMTGGKLYLYYYHNVKIEGKCRNICLGGDLEKAKRKLRKIMLEKKKKNKPISHIIKDYWKPGIL